MKSRVLVAGSAAAKTFHSGVLRSASASSSIAPLRRASIARHTSSSEYSSKPLRFPMARAGPTNPRSARCCNTTQRSSINCGSLSTCTGIDSAERVMPNQLLEAPSRIVSASSLQPAGSKSRKCGRLARQLSDGSSAAASPKASDMRRLSPQLSHFTSRLTASSDAPTLRRRSGPLQFFGPRCTKRSHGKSSRCPCEHATRKRDGSATGAVPGLLQFAWT